ncbi:MAG: 2-amino-4-hydroxy-6-hydroxymethyldihydropteridine diphosphokinase [Muribaculaceae bacterium]
MTYYINIGSNLGDKMQHLRDAVQAVERRLGVKARCSDAVTSPPWGFESSNTFANMAVAVQSSLPPHDMLNVLKLIEDQIGTSVHRDAQGQYCDRVIDLDIMAIDDLVIDTPTLQVPHRHLAERYFFLRPFCDLAPHWQHPISGATLQQMLAQLK